MRDLTNSTIGRYEVMEPIGQGSMGTVYRGFDSINAREVALKVANREKAENVSTIINPHKLFFNEAKVAGQLKHPNIVSVFDAGIDQDVGEDVWYIVMEFVSGGLTLQDHTVPSNLLALEKVVEIGVKCAVALDYAHRKGVVHRDIKPRNILLTENYDAKLADFGVAMLTNFDATETQLRGYVGSPLYMAPEQINDEDVSSHSDIFSLGVVLYEMIAGRNPFAADTLPTIIRNILTMDPQPLSSRRSDTPHILERIVDRCLKRERRERYQSAMDLAGDLSLVFDTLDVPQERISTRQKFDRIKHLSFFAAFTEPELWEVLNAAYWHEFAPGEPIISEGDIDDSFFIIVAGEVDVRKGETRVDTLRAGDCFGEMAFIAGQQRTASIYAGSDVVAMQVRSSLIERASMACQLRFHKVFLHAMVSRLSAATRRVHEFGPS
jgi:serine/threonine protein kinase